MVDRRKQTKEEIRTNLNTIGFDKAQVDRALFVYERNYAIYDPIIVKEIMYRLNVKDKLKTYQQVHKTVFDNRMAVKHALSEMDLHDYYIDMAIKQYEGNSYIDGLAYDLEKIVETIMQLRALYSPNNMPQDAPSKSSSSKQNMSKLLLPPAHITTAGAIHHHKKPMISDHNSDLLQMEVPKMNLLRINNKMGSSSISNSGGPSGLSSVSITHDTESIITGGGDIEIMELKTPEGSEIHQDYHPDYSHSNGNGQHYNPHPHPPPPHHQKVRKKKQPRHHQHHQQYHHQHMGGYSKPQSHDTMSDVVDAMIIEEQFHNGENQRVGIDHEMFLELKSQYSLSQSNSNQNFQRIRMIEQEIVSTERSYVEGLNILLNELILPMFEKQYIDKKYYLQIVSTIPAMLSFHEEFLTEMNTIFNSNCRSLAVVFNKCILEKENEFVQMYMKFVADYNQILDLFGNTFHGKKLLDQFLKQMRKQKKGFLNYLIIPIQRIPRYMLLLQNLKKYTNRVDSDYYNIDKALTMITQIGELINSEQKKIENIAECLAIQEQLHGLKFPIIDTTNQRKFEGKFNFIESDKHRQREFYVFNDIVIITNNKKNVKFILDIRTMDIKRQQNKSPNLKKADIVNDGTSFRLITGITKPMTFISFNEADVARIEQLIEVNRYDIWAEDMMESSASGKKSVGSLRSQLARQLALVM